MKHAISSTDGFVAGIVVGLGTAAVAALAIGAVWRRGYARHEHPHMIDGINPPNDVELALTPAPEGNTTPRRLASESVDVPETTQRW